ncbi:hypothetical protein K456DRAFT_58195 [Colletotrichum gloeosporioides 23]|nr:hypothetical protein K456DRAFT_58195 [Colletotrichum gloeosporioides 23]
MREFYDDGKRSPSTLELSECFQSVLATVEEAVIVVDALDECKEETKEQERLIKWILQLDSATTLKHVKILTTARPEACFKIWMNEELSDANCVHLDTEAMKNDIESYVKGLFKR